MDGLNNNDNVRNSCDSAFLQRQSTQQLINLSNLPPGLVQRQSTSISINGVSYFIDKLIDARSQVAEVEALEAVQSGDEAKIGALCDSKDRTSLVALIKAALKVGTFDLVRRALLKWKELSDLGSHHHHDFLHVATLAGRLDLCQFLVETYGFSVNAFDETRDKEESPVHCAASVGGLDILQYLHEDCGGDLNATASKQIPWTPLMAAVKANQVTIVDYLLQKKATTAPASFSTTAMHMAAEGNQVECLNLLLQYNAMVDPLRGQRDRETPLHLACQQGFLEASKVLLAHGADPNARNGRGEMPLHMACKVLAQPLISLLLDKGSLIEAVDFEGRPPLHYLINSRQKGGTSECLKLLLSKGADINQVDNTGLSPVHIAALCVNSNRLERLIEHGADLCVRNVAKQSGLQFAMKYLPKATTCALEGRFDKCIQTSSTIETEPDVNLNFEPLLPPPAVNSNHPRSEVELFSEILRFHAGDFGLVEKLLLHPLSQCFLHLKWAQIQKFYYIIIVLPHLIYSIIYTIYSMTVYRCLCPDLQQECYPQPGREGLINLALACWMIMIFSTAIYVGKEISKIRHQKWIYFKETESWLNMITIVSFALTSFHTTPFEWEKRRPSMALWQYHVNGFAMFFTWLLQMFIVGRIPQFGLYVEVFKKVSWTFLNFFFAFLFLFVAFATSFILLFPTHRAFPVDPSPLLKVLVMMLGELEYDDLYFPTMHKINKVNETFESITDEFELGYHTFPYSSHFILAIFIVFVSIVIMNLLFGLAVADIQELYKVARVHQLIQQVQSISYMEKSLHSLAVICLPKKLQNYIRIQLQGLRKQGRFVKVSSLVSNKIITSDLANAVRQKSHLTQRAIEQDSASSTDEKIKELFQKLDLIIQDISILKQQRMKTEQKKCD